MNAMCRCRSVIFGVLLVSATVLGNKGDDTTTCYKNEKSVMLWDMVHFCVSKGKDIYFNMSKEHKSSNARRERTLPYLEKAKQLILELEENYLPDEPALENSVKPLPPPALCNQKPLDCTDILNAGNTNSGVYTIWPADKELEAFCDMDTDGGGWTVIQRRGNFSNQEDFFREWEDYTNGFGDITRDFWLGNENIYLMTNQSQYELRFDLMDAQGDRRFAAYQTFWLENGDGNYTLHIDGYSGDAGDSMAYHNGHKFSTKDSETSKCAKERMGGWWYDFCTESNLNGLYKPGVEGREGMTWYSWHHHTSLAGSEIKLRKKN